MKHAVICGDFPEAHATEVDDKKEASIDIVQRHAEKPERFARHPGRNWNSSGFQLYVDDPEQALLVAAKITIFLMNTDLYRPRMAIGYGTVDSLGRDGNMAAARGEAFRLSGWAFDAMKPGEWLTFVDENNPPQKRKRAGEGR